MKRTIILFFLLVLAPFAGLSQQWSIIPGYIPANAGYGLKRMTNYNDTLFLGGAFQIEQFGNFRPLATWNSDTLEYHFPLSMYGGFFCVNDFQGERYYGGDIYDYQDPFGPLSTLLRWDGLNFYPVGNSFCSPTEHVNDMAIYDGRLIIGGSLHSVDCNEDIEWGNLAAWDGNSWEAIGGVYGGWEVEEFIEYNGRLYVMGDFDKILPNNYYDADVITVNNIASWDGTTWAALGIGVNGRVHDAVVDTVNNMLVVCGSFSSASGTFARKVAAWDGNQWFAVGDEPTGGEAFAIEWYRGQLYIGGYNVFGDHDLAYFDGYHWQEVPGANFYSGQLSDLRTYHDELYISGSMTEIAGIQVPGFVKYYLHPDSVVWGQPDDIAEFNSENNLFNLFPNPTDGMLQLVFQNRYEGEIILTNIEGRELLRTVAKGERVQLDISHFPKGSYLIHALSNGRILGTRKVVLE